MAHLYIFGTIFFTVYGQLVIKWRIPNYGHLPEETMAKMVFLLKLFFRPFYLKWICLCVCCFFMLDGGDDEV